jgi:hypothetical protein
LDVECHVARSVNDFIVGIRGGIGDEATGGVEQSGGAPGEFGSDGIDGGK